MTQLQAIQDYVHQHKEDILHLLEQVVNIESGPDQPENIREIHAVLKPHLEEIGCKIRTVAMDNGADVLIADWDNGSQKAPIVFGGHIDTVFYEGTVIKHPFHIIEDKAYGPGVLDMKSGVVMAIYVLKALHAIGYNNYPIRLVIVGDEETAHRFTTADQVMMDEFTGAEFMLNFESGRLDHHFYTSRKGAAIMKVMIEGVSAHSGVGARKGRSAILEAAHKIVALEALNDLDRGKMINCGVIEGGTSANTIPGDCEFLITYRFPTQRIKEEIEADLKKVLNDQYVEDTKTTYEMQGMIDAFEMLETVHSLFDHFQQVAKSMEYGPLEAVTGEGGSDAAYASKVGVPAICSVGGPGEHAHTLEEYISIPAFFERLIFITEAVNKYQ